MTSIAVQKMGIKAELYNDEAEQTNAQTNQNTKNRAEDDGSYAAD